MTLTIEWASCYDEETDNCIALMYVFEHLDIYDGTLRILRSDWPNIDLTWSGKCDIKFDDDYNCGLPFLIEGAFLFDSVYIPDKGDATLACKEVGIDDLKPGRGKGLSLEIFMSAATQMSKGLIAALWGMLLKTRMCREKIYSNYSPR